MISGTSAKIRLVKCPKCWHILPELPDVPVYECGVCGTRLQAKILRNNAKSTADLREIDTIQTNKLDYVYEDKKSSSSSDETIPQPLGECSLVEKNARDRIISGRCGSKELSCINEPDEDQNNGSAQNEREHFDDALLGDARDRTISGSCESKELSGINEPDEAQDNGSAQNEPEHFDDALLGDARDCIISGIGESEELSGINEPDEDQDNGSAQNEPGHFDDVLLGGARDRIIAGSGESEEFSGINEPDEAQDNGSAQNEPEHFDDALLGDARDRIISGSGESEEFSGINEPEEAQDNGSAQNEPEHFDDALLGDARDCIISGIYESEELSGINEPVEDQNNGSAQNEPEHFDDALLGDARDCITSRSCEELSGINEPDEDHNNGSAQNESEHFDDALLEDARDCMVCSSCESEELCGINLTDEDPDKESAQNEPEHLANVPLGDAIFSNEYHENGIVEYKCKDFDDGTLGDIKFSDRDQNQSDQNDSPYCKNEQSRIINEVSSSIKLVDLENKESFPSGGGNSALKSNNESSASAGAKAEEESNNDSDSSFGRTKTWNIIDTKWSSSINDTHNSAGKSMPSKVPLARADVQLKQPVQITNHLPDNIRSAGAFERTEFVNPSSELSDTLIDLSKSPTTRSSRAYYDDGISSCEETDGPLSNQNKYSFKSAHKPASSATSDGRHGREKVLANGNYTMQNQLRDYASTASGKAFNDRKLTGLDHDNLLNSTSLCHQLGNRRLQRNEYPPQLPFYQKDYVSGFGSNGPSNQLHNEFIYSSHKKLVYTQQEKLKLLKMVEELQDQLSKSYSSNEKPNGRTSMSSWKDQQVPYRGHALKEGSYHNLNYYKYPAIARDGNSWPQGSEYPGMPFSAEATCFWQQVDHSLYCCPQGWQSSAQIPGSGLHCNCGFCAAHSGINFYNFCGSFPSSPQQCLESEFLVHSHGAKSHVQRQRDHEVRKYSREKPHLAKRHIRPMAAGLPFITCKWCLNILQLPADFLLSNGRCHQLRCGACLEVLKFTLLKRNHLLPYAPTAPAPPPSEVDQYSDATNGIICSSHSGDCPRVDPVSFSDDYELSLCKSHYKSGETLPASHCNAAERNASYGLVDPDKGRKKILNEPQQKHKSVVEAYDSASSSKKFSHANKTSAGESSPLHRLMGYSSPSELINGCGASSSGGDLGDKNFSYYAGEGSRQRI